MRVLQCHSTPSFPVSPPMISVSSPNLPVFAGSTLTLDCIIRLRTEFELRSEVAITAIWKRNGTVLVDTATRMMSDVVEISNTSYLSQLMFNPLQLGLDDGVYDCEARIEPPAGFVLGSISQSNRASLRVTGMNIISIESLEPHMLSYSIANRGSLA